VYCDCRRQRALKRLTSRATDPKVIAALEKIAATRANMASDRTHPLTEKRSQHACVQVTDAHVPVYAATRGMVPRAAVGWLPNPPARSCRNKSKAVTESGSIRSTGQFAGESEEGELLDLIAQLNTDRRLAASGAVVALPPQAIRKKSLRGHINPDKDGDGFHPIKSAGACSGLPGWCHAAARLNLWPKTSILRSKAL